MRWIAQCMELTSGHGPLVEQRWCMALPSAGCVVCGWLEGDGHLAVWPAIFLQSNQESCATLIDVAPCRQQGGKKYRPERRLMSSQMHPKAKVYTLCCTIHLTTPLQGSLSVTWYVLRVAGSSSLACFLALITRGKTMSCGSAYRKKMTKIIQNIWIAQNSQIWLSAHNERIRGSGGIFPLIHFGTRWMCVVIFMIRPFYSPGVRRPGTQ